LHLIRKRLHASQENPRADFCNQLLWSKCNCRVRKRRSIDRSAHGCHDAGVLLDAPAKENKHGEWWNFVAEKVPQLAASGFDSLWLPPFSKAASPNSMGYDPYDYFDLGDLDQKGSVKTAYGNRAELEKLIRSIHEHKMGAIADMVINHNSGADEEEINPLDGKKRWTKFNPRAASFRATGTAFIPAAMNG